MVIAAILILRLSALLGVKPSARCSIPRVAGEIIGGILLGPIGLGWLLPGAHAYIFTSFAHQGQVISMFYWLGLILLMFTSGYEANLQEWRIDKKIIGWLIAGSTVIPRISGYYVSDIWFVRHYVGEAGNPVAFNLIFAIATAVTSIPVISKIFLDLGIAMNAHGGPGNVLAGVTYEMGIINYEFFSVLIFVTIVTGAVAGCWINYINRKCKLLTF